MTIATQEAIVTELGDGVNTVFNYGFRIPFQADGVTPAVAVSILDTESGEITPLDLGIDFSITGIGNDAGGVVNYPLAGSPLAATESITILRDQDVLQSSPVPNQAFWPNIVEVISDWVTMLVQRATLEARYALRFPRQEGGPDRLPSKVLRKTTLFGFDADGNWHLYPQSDFGGGGGAPGATSKLITSASVDKTISANDVFVEVQADSSNYVVTMDPLSNSIKLCAILMTSNGGGVHGVTISDGGSFAKVLSAAGAKALIACNGGNLFDVTGV